jgi:hypothetical protein
MRALYSLPSAAQIFKDRMVITIGLVRANYEQLLHNLAPESPALIVLSRCPELYRWGRDTPLFKCVIIECNRDEAIVLLDAAKEHCAEAVADIEYGLKLSRAFDLIS